LMRMRLPDIETDGAGRTDSRNGGSDQLADQ